MNIAFYKQRKIALVSAGNFDDLTGMVGPAEHNKQQLQVLYTQTKMSTFNGMDYVFEPARDRPVVSDYHHMEDDQF